MAVYGPVRHQKNIIWTETYTDRSVTKTILYGPKLLKSIQYFFGDGPVHILPYDQKWHELFAILYFLSKIMQVPGRSIYENSDSLVIWTILCVKRFMVIWTFKIEVLKLFVFLLSVYSNPEHTWNWNSLNLILLRSDLANNSNLKTMLHC